MSIDNIASQWESVQRRLSGASYIPHEEKQRLTGLFCQIIESSSISYSDKATILELENRVTNGLTQKPQEEVFDRIFQILLRHCSDETIARILGLDTWQSGERSFFGGSNGLDFTKLKIIQCVKYQQSLLSLNFSKFTSLPPSMFKYLTFLKTFECTNGKLITLPPEIGQLTQLQELNCSNNKITSLPPSMFKSLTSLKTFKCQNCDLIELPPEIGQLAQLKELNCRDNKLTSLPNQIGQLTQLKELNCNDNKLTSLPDQIGQLTELRNLKCRNNQLESLPVAFRTLNRVYFDFFNNNIRMCPPELSRLGVSLFGQRTPATAQHEWAHMQTRTEQETNLRSTIRFQTGDFDREQDNFLREVDRLLELTHPRRSRTPEEDIELDRILMFPTQPMSLPKARRQQSSCLNELQEAVSNKRQDLKYLETPMLQANGPLWQTISQWLDKLTISADFKKESTRPMMAERVLSILKLAEENKKYRKSLSAILTEALSSCSDRATLPLCPLEIQKAILESKDGSMGQMLKVLKGAFASELIEGYARQYMKTHGGVDEIEVYLGFQLKLKEEFCLPIGVQNMNFFGSSAINDADVRAAKAHVQQGLQNQEKFIEFLLMQTVWAEKLGKDFPAEKQAYLASLSTKLDQLQERMYANALSDMDYLREANLLKTQYAEAEKRWLMGKSQELCFNIPSGQLKPLETVIIVKCKNLPSNQDLYIRGNRAGLNWDRGVKLTALDWETFMFKTNVPFTGELDYKFLINDDHLKWEKGDNHKVTQHKTAECTHAFHPALLPPLKKTVVELDFPVPAGKMLFLSGTGPLGNWDRKVPMRRAGNDSSTWFLSFDGEFKDFEYKLRLGDAWELGGNRVAQCGKQKQAAMKQPRF